MSKTDSKVKVVKDLEGVIEHTRQAELTHQDNPEALAALAAMRRAAQRLMEMKKPN